MNKDAKDGACNTRRKVIQYFGCKTSGKETLGTPRRRWEGNVI
jgi:hypothetical protein